MFQIVSESGRREMNLQISGKIFLFSEESIVSELNGMGSTNAESKKRLSYVRLQHSVDNERRKKLHSNM